MNIKNLATDALGKATDTFNENKPAIMIFAGAASLLAAGVCAAITTHKHEAELESIKGDISAIKNQKEAIGEPLPEDDSVLYTKKDFIVTYMPKAIIKIAKKVAMIYGIPFATAMAGVVSIIFGYKKEHGRYVEAAELATTVLGQFAAYRKAVVEKFGQETDDDIMGFKKEVIETPILDKNGEPKTDKNGVVKTSKETKYILDAERFEKLSPLAFIWGEVNPDGTINTRYSPEDDQYNEAHINNVEVLIGHKVYGVTRSYTYNEVREAFDRNLTGYMDIGWHINDPRMDDAIDLRARKIEYRVPACGDQVFEGYIIDPNCCGDISKWFDTDPEDFENNTYTTIH